eukprot:528364-Rhodomonas_salina.2
MKPAKAGFSSGTQTEAARESARESRYWHSKILHELYRDDAITGHVADAAESAASPAGGPAALRCLNFKLARQIRRNST